ncbi:MAG: flagellar type III secretion system pore protein FliP [bacterium]
MTSLLGKYVNTRSGTYVSKFMTVVLLSAIFLVISGAFSTVVAQTDFGLPTVEFGVKESEGPQDMSLALQLIFLVTILGLAPSIVLMMTCFTRIFIVFSFVGRALSLQGMPPKQILASLAIFLTIFIMAPTMSEINKQALQPYMNGELTQLEAVKEASKPIRAFMMKNMSKPELAFFLKTADIPKPETRADVPFWVLLPAFMLSEVKKAFVMGVLIFMPFVVIDMVVASVLMSMGMMMLPPVMISLPFKILLFVIVDGWTLITQSIVETYGVS